MMKKILTAALAAIVLATTLTGCGNSTSNDSSVESALTLSASDMAERALGHNSNNWSMAMTLADDETLPILLPELTSDMFEDLCFYFDMIGISGHSVFVGKPKAGQEDAVKTAIENSLKSFKEQVSFYPAGKESVAGAVSGTTSHGYEYFVIHQDGAAIASAMVDPNAPTVDFSNRGEPDDDPSNENPGDDTPALEFPSNRAGDMVRTALETKPEYWSDEMTIATNEELPKILKGITTDMFDEFCLAYDFIVGQAAFAAKPMAGQEDAAKTAFESAFNNYKAEIAMSPDGAANAENAVSGTTDDGYLYFVIHADGAAIASAMTSPVF